MPVKIHIIPPQCENIADPQPFQFQPGVLSTPTSLSFNKIDEHYHAQGAVGILYMIKDYSEFEYGNFKNFREIINPIFKVLYVLEPELSHENFVVDNTYKEFGYARARCEYLNASALWKHTLKHLSEARKMLEEYNLLTDQPT